LFVLLIPLLFFFFVFRLARRFRAGASPVPRRTTGRGPNLGMLRAELSVLADDVLRFEPQIAMHPDARDDYDSATHRYKVAQAALDQSEADVDLVRVQRVVDEATYAMSRARSIVEGRTPPEPPPVLQQAGRRGEPAVELDERRNPVYVGSPAPFRTGWFGVGGGLFGGLLLGSMFFEAVRDAFEGFVAGVNGRRTIYVHSRGVKVWFDDESREHYESQLIQVDGRPQLEIGFHANIPRRRATKRCCSGCSRANRSGAASSATTPSPVSSSVVPAGGASPKCGPHHSGR
jgi:hypothetical protein